MSVPIECPNCGTGHLHVSVLVDADSDNCRWVATGGDADGVDVAYNADGLLQAEEAFVSCCACDWSDTRSIRFTR